MCRLSLLSSLFVVFLSLTGCAKQAEAPMSLHWEFGRNDVEPGVCEAYLTITNLSGDTLGSDWKLYFGLMSLRPIYNEGQALKETEIMASYHSLEPTAAFSPLPPESSRTVMLRYRGNAIRENTIPEGFFLVRTDVKHPRPVSVTCTYAPYTRREQMMRGIETWEKTPYADGEYVYTYVDHILNADSTDRTDTDVAGRILPLLPQPKQVTWRGTPRPCVAKEALSKREDSTIPHEGYRIEVGQDSLYLYASSREGFFYGEQTIIRLYQADETWTSGVEAIADAPDLAHRGLMLDIVRHYYPVDSIMRVIDVMADYKLNVLHLHLSDDEGWRLEIPGLPELTEVGSLRGYTPDEHECLWPMYNGGWDTRDKSTMSNGYVTRKDFIRLLRYAHARCIRVIPEIDMPGHMRAAKKAMHGLLTDSVLEQRAYVSAQNYTDNVIAVTNLYAVTFIDKVVTEIGKMYAEAEVPFTVFNIGGDEVPKGSLTREEHQLFMDSVIAILQRNNLQPIGWEEITHFCSPQTRAICYSWHNGIDKALEMADDGYPVVMATANRVYFDFAYCNHHQEKGLNWGGYTDEYRAFDWTVPVHANIIGMNAQLWAEVIRSFRQVEWQIYPKLFGMSERAWNTQSRLSLRAYNDLVYGVCLPALHESGHAFHLQQPGIRVRDGQVTMNKVMTGGDIVYRVDDGEWQHYDRPFAVDTAVISTIKAKVQYLGSESNTTWWWAR